MAEIDALYRRAEEAFGKRNFDYARDLFAQILLLQPNHASSRKGLRIAVVQKYKTLGGAPSRLKLTMISAKTKVELAAARNNPQKKADIAQKYLLDDPDNSEIRAALAEALSNLNHHEGAAAEAEMALEADPKNITAAKTLVLSYKNLGKIPEAQEILGRIAKYVPEDRDLEKMQRDLAATAAAKAGFEDAAQGGKEGFRSAIRDAGQAEQLQKRAQLIKTEDDARNYIADVTKEFTATPDYKLARNIGDTYLNFLKDPEHARDWFKKAMEINPQDSTLKDRVEDCTLKQYETQIAQADKAKDPRLKEYQANRLRFLIQSFERRVLDRPTDMAIHFELGRAYYSARATAGFLDKAIAEFQQSVKDPKKAADSHFYLGLGFQSKKLFDMADTQYEKAESGGVMGQQKRLEILYHRAKCNAEAGKFARAIEIGKKIMESDINYKDISALVEQWVPQAK